MATLVIDTLKLTQKLKTRGYTEEQAIGFTEALQDINLDQMASKDDIKDLKILIAENQANLIKWMFSGFMAVFVMLFGIFLKIT